MALCQGRGGDVGGGGMDSGGPMRGGRRRDPGRLPRALATVFLLTAPLRTDAALGQDGAAPGSAPKVAPAPKPSPPKPSVPKPLGPKPLAPKETPSKAAAPDPAFEAAKAAFEALPEADRKALQDALVWTGDFNAVVSGAFGRRTFEALEAFRARAGGDPSDPRGRAAIRAAGEAAKTAARFKVAADPGSGAVIGVPERLLSKRSALAAGTRWQSADGRVTLETRAYPPGGETLDALFERATAALNDRKVTYRLRRPDVIVVSAETGPGLSYTRYASGPQGVRGFLIGYDRALAPEVDRLVIAVANAFDPFPGVPAAAPAPPAAGPPVLPAPAAAMAARIAGTGLAVAPGRVLTAASVLDGCSPRIGAAAVRVLATDPAGLALLEAPGTPMPVLPALRTEPIIGAAGLIALAAGPDGVSAAPGEGVAGGVIAPLQPGSAGAPVLDRAGRLAGLVARYPAAPRVVAGVVPPARLPLVPAASVSAFLAGQGILPSAPRRDDGPGAVVSAVVAIGCR